MNIPALEQAFCDEWAPLVATLFRRLGDLQRAEDAAQDAFAAAALAWPRDGVPSKPGAWLAVTAWRKALNQLRRDKVAAEHAGEVWLASGADWADEDLDPSLDTHDDQLLLVFTCCHPALPLDTRIALTLRYVAGLTTREIASALLLAEPTLAQRLVRAKRKIREAGINFQVPGADALTERLAGVQSVIYLVFNEGYAASCGGEVVRADLCDEAIWLGRMLHRLLPRDAETTGLLALMLLHRSRLAGRFDEQGRPVPLKEQDRGRWLREMIEEGVALLDEAVARRSPGRYQLQAAIAAIHAQANAFDSTDWNQIAALYGELARREPSPVVEVNRAVAVGLADGPRAGLAVLEPVLAMGALDSYGPAHAAHADLLDRQGKPQAAAAAWARAIEATRNEVLREELRRRVAERAGGPPDPGKDGEDGEKMSR
jgi:RNA polymerase sigma-70 factor (ECF subfamily)